MIENIAFLAREDKRVDKRSGVSQRLPITVLENVASNAERRALRTGETEAVPRILDIYAALPSITGKLELEYEGELKGGDAVAREVIRSGRRQGLQLVFRRREHVADHPVVRDGRHRAAGRESVDSATMIAATRTASRDCWRRPGSLDSARMRPDALRASAAEFILEGLYAHRRISRSEEREFSGEEKRRARTTEHAAAERSAEVATGNTSEVDQLLALHR